MVDTWSAPPTETEPDLPPQVAPVRHAWLAPAAAAAVALAGCAYLATHDPNDPNQLMPECPTKWLTGLDCPACGGLRMVRALITGHWSAAVHDNVVVLALLPFIGYVWVRWLVAGVRGTTYRFVIGRRTGFAILGVALVWMVVRNLPGFPLKPGG